MKRIIAFIMTGVILVLPLLLSSCNKETVYQKVSRAIDKTLSLYQFDVSVVEKICSSTDDLEQTFSSEFKLTVKEINSHFKEHSANLYVEQPHFVTDVDIYAKNGVYYIDIGGKKILEDDSEKTSSYDMEKIYRKMLRPLPEELFEDAGLTNDTLELSLSSEQFLEVFGEYINSSLGNLGDLTLKGPLTADNGKITICIKNGYVLSYFVSCKLIFDIEYSQQVTNCSIDIDNKIYVNNPGGDVNVKIPINLDSYVHE